MNEEFGENIEGTETEEIVHAQLQEDAVEEDAPKPVHTESVVGITEEVQPEAILTQAEDGSWRHADNSPFSPFYVPDRKQKSKSRLTVGLVILLLVLLMGCLIFAVSKLIEAAVGEVTVAWNESANTVEEFLKRYNEDEKSHDESGYDDYYVPRPDDDYYVELADYVRDDLSYSVEFEEYTHSDYESSIYISVWYAQVSEEVKNSELINEFMMDGALYYASVFEEDSTTNLSIEVESFVTYMDEEILSVAISERVSWEGNVFYNLYCMNFDLKTGTLLNNTDIIEVSDDLVDAFVDQSIYQNGHISIISDYTREEIADFMRDEESLILFYTPVGLEIGYNHPNGWVTATLKDYQRFLKRL